MKRLVLVSALVLAMVCSTALPPVEASTRPDGAYKAPTLPEFERLRNEGNDALYSLDYQTARERFKRMSELAPDHPAGFVYLANTLWLETLHHSRRLSASVYSSASFYAESKEADKVDPKRDREFNALIKQALTASVNRLQSNSKDAEALYYQAAAFGTRAGYGASVARSFTRAIGDANDSVVLMKKVLKLDPSYTDAYLNIGFYEYVIDSLSFGWRLLARMAGLKGSKKKGIEHLEMVVQNGKHASDDAAVVLLGVYTRENQHERALEIIGRLATKYPENYLFGIERAAMLIRMGRKDEGQAAFAEMLGNKRAEQAVNDLINYQWAEGLFLAKDYRAAVERYTAVKRWPKSDPGLVSLAQLHLGQALDAMGKRSEAVSEYQAVLKRDNIFDSHDQANQFIKTPYSPVR